LPYIGKIVKEKKDAVGIEAPEMAVRRAISG
jgi:hypothetical protein